MPEERTLVGYIRGLFVFAAVVMILMGIHGLRGGTIAVTSEKYVDGTPARIIGGVVFVLGIAYIVFMLVVWPILTR
jgi:hypothetical protein